MQQDTYVPNLKVLPHQKVKRGTRVRPYRADAAATVSQEPQAQVCTLLSLFFKQQLRELEKQHMRNLALGRTGTSTRTRRPGQSPAKSTHWHERKSNPLCFEGNDAHLNHFTFTVRQKQTHWQHWKATHFTCPLNLLLHLHP